MRPLTPRELDEIRRRAERYDGPYTPTYAAFARDVLRLADEVERLSVPWWRRWLPRQAHASSRGCRPDCPRITGSR